MQNNRYTLEQAKQLVIDCYTDFYNGQTTKISDWEFNELLDMILLVEPDFKSEQPKELKRIREQTKITKNGKLKGQNIKFCPICGSCKIRDNYCYNPTCKYWYDIIYSRLLSCLSVEDRNLLRYANSLDFDSIKVVITKEKLDKILSDIANIRKIYSDDTINTTNLDELPDYITVHLKHYLKLWKT